MRFVAVAASLCSIASFGAHTMCRDWVVLVPQTNAAAIAQDGGTIRGVVRDDRQQPMRDAAVTLEGTDKTVRTGADGKFQFRNVGAGPYAVVVRRVGMAPDSRSVVVKANATVELTFVLSALNTLDTTRVLGKSLFRSEYDDRRARKLGYAVDTAILNHRADLFSALSNIPLVQITRTTFGITVRIRQLGTRGTCTPLAFLDGLPTPLESVTALPPDSFRAIEMLPWEVTPAKYLDGRRCIGAILFWSKKTPW